MNVFYLRIKRLYQAAPRAISMNGVRLAVEKGWLSAAEFRDITGDEYTA